MNCVSGEVASAGVGLPHLLGLAETFSVGSAEWADSEE